MKSGIFCQPINSDSTAMVGSTGQTPKDKLSQLGLHAKAVAQSSVR